MLTFLFTILGCTFSISLLPNFAYSVSEVKNERNCNASHIFAPISAFETAYAMIANSGQVINFSEQWVLSNSFNHTCSGDSPLPTLDFLLETGTYYEAVYPYYGQPINLPSLTYPVFKISNYESYSVSSAEDFLNLIKNSPAVVRIYYDESQKFLNYRGGVYNCNDNFADVHYMLAVYNPDSVLKGTVFLKNNWGVGWGNQGFLELNLTSSNHKGPCNLYEEIYQVFLS